MQLVPLAFLAVSGLYSLLMCVYWLLVNHSPLHMELVRFESLFTGLIYGLLQFTLHFLALLISLVVLFTKKYSNKSVYLGITFVLAIFNVAFFIWTLDEVLLLL